MKISVNLDEDYKLCQVTLTLFDDSGSPTQMIHAGFDVVQNDMRHFAKSIAEKIDEVLRYAQLSKDYSNE